ncbi:hypothetical protein CHUAL_009478 [Chamberlinius hualienensis]
MQNSNEVEEDVHMILMDTCYKCYIDTFHKMAAIDKSQCFHYKNEFVTTSNDNKVEEKQLETLRKQQRWFEHLLVITNVPLKAIFTQAHRQTYFLTP